MKDASALAGSMIVIAVIAALGPLLVPAHLTSIWMDFEFSGWVAPIANRLGGDLRLYDFGLHSPMPPLPTLLVHLLFPAGATWFDESALNYFFQSATILTLYFAFTRHWGIVGLISALAAVPVFFSLTKVMLYDSLAQFLVALTAVVAVSSTNDSDGGRFHWSPMLTGCLLGLLALTKQSTGVGTAAGVILLFMVRPGSTRVRERLHNVLFLLAAGILTFLVFCLLAGRWVSIEGMIEDVFWRGSEPKGGGVALLINLAGKTRQLGARVVVTGCVFFALAWSLRKQVPTFAEVLRRPGSMLTGGSTPSPSRTLPVLAVGALVSAACLATFYLFPHRGGWIELPQLLRPHRLLNMGLLLCLASAGAVLFGARSAALDFPEGRYALVFLFSALFHSLSVQRFRWQYDNNPLIVLALAFVAGLCVSITRLRWRGRDIEIGFGPAMLAALLVLGTWPRMVDRMQLVARCTERWGEIAHLLGARLRPEASGMRELIRDVRSFSDQEGSEVLLLPNDPNVEAWFERPRPQLSSAIVFVDQYWDRFVDMDFAALERNPPEVIVIGPRNVWRGFSRQWQANRGAERLIDLVVTRLLPGRYTLRKAQEIAFHGGVDYMDVYVASVAPR